MVKVVISSWFEMQSVKRAATNCTWSIRKVRLAPQPPHSKTFLWSGTWPPGGCRTRSEVFQTGRGRPDIESQYDYKYCYQTANLSNLGIQYCSIGIFKVSLLRLIVSTPTSSLRQTGTTSLRRYHLFEFEIQFVISLFKSYDFCNFCNIDKPLIDQLNW